MSEEELDKEFDEQIGDQLIQINEIIVKTVNRLLSNHWTELAKQFLDSIQHDIIIQRFRVTKFEKRERLQDK